MRVLVIAPHYWPEPFRFSDVVAGLKSRGHHVEVLTTLPHYPAGRFYDGYGLSGAYSEVHEGVKVWRVPVVPRGNGRAAELAINYATFSLAATVAALGLGRRKWDVTLVLQTSPVTILLPAVLLRTLFGVPFVTWIQDLWPESIRSAGMAGTPGLYAFAGGISSFLYRRSDLVLGSSRAYCARLAARGIDPRRFAYLPQWVEELPPTDPEGVTVSEGPWMQGFPVVFAGNLGRVQGLDTLIDAAELLRDEPQVRWVFLGDGSRRQWLETEIARRGLQDRVFWLGRKPASDMPAYYAKAAALIVSLAKDDMMALTVPGKVQSVLAAGRPVLGSIDGEGARVIDESGSGWAAPAGDARAFVSLVRRMKALSPSEREAMGAAGRAYSTAHFARERCLDELARLLATAADSRAQV